MSPRHAPLLLTALSILVLGAQANAQDRAAFPHPDGTTHWYEVVAVPAGVNWIEAQLAAAKRGGYLASITSKEENEFVFGLVDDARYWQPGLKAGTLEGPWLGGVQLAGGSEPSGGWAWTELEEWNAPHWTAGEPDNDSSADRLHFGVTGTTRKGDWADSPASKKLRSYVVEYAGTFAPRTIGLLDRQPGSQAGYTLIAPQVDFHSFLVDERGRYVHSWLSRWLPGAVTFLQPNGDLVRTGMTANTNFPNGTGGVVEVLGWDSSVKWTYIYSTDKYCQHHDVDVLPNGNFLLLVWQEKTKAEAIAAGRDPSTLPDGRLLIDRLIEVQPTGPTTGKIVWEWTMWDHLVQDFDPKLPNYGKPDEHPNRIDINYVTLGGDEDWTHSNAVEYNAELDQIMISVRHFNEVWVIDHSTTTAEARTGAGGRSGEGGRLLYRWGNPEAYGAGTKDDQTLFFQHDCTWIPGPQKGEWNALVFNNGNARPEGNYSSADEWQLPTPDPKTGTYPRAGKAWGPKAPSWTFTTPEKTDMFSPFISGAQRLPNGNTLVCSGAQGWIVETTPQNRIVWQYKNPLGGGIAWFQGQESVPLPWVFRSYRYPPDFEAFANRKLKGTEPIEAYRSALLVEGSTAPHFAPYGSEVGLALRTRKKDRGQVYVLGTSMTEGQLPIDHRYWPVGFDLWLQFSVTGTWTSVFPGYVGVLNEAGRAKAQFLIPDLRWLRGRTFYTSALVFDSTARSGVRLLSNVVELTITDK